MFKKELAPRGSRAMILGRYSSPKQNPLSADDQIARCMDDCERNGWVVVKTFKDEALSGRFALKRKGYIEMMAAAAAGEADVICVFSLDRLGRNSRELHDARNRLRDSNVELFFHDRGVMGNLEFAVWAELSEIESQKIGERSSRGLRREVERGAILGALPYGYMRIAAEKISDEADPVKARVGRHGIVVINPEEAKVVIRVMEDFVAGMSPYKIARALTVEGIPTPMGKQAKWLVSTIHGNKIGRHGILRNPLYNGEFIYGVTQYKYDAATGSRKRVASEIGPEEPLDRQDLRIPSVELWNKVQARLVEIEGSACGPKRKPPYLLTGIVKCGVCGHDYLINNAKMGCSGRSAGVCNNRRRITHSTLIDIAFKGLADRLNQPDIYAHFIPEYIRHADLRQKDYCERITRLQSQVNLASEEISNLMMQIRQNNGATAITTELLNRELDKLGADRLRLEKEVTILKGRSHPLQTPDQVARSIPQWLSELGDAVQGDGRDAVRAKEILKSFLHTITVIPVEEAEPDGRGIGPMKIIVSAASTPLLDAAFLSRTVEYMPGPLHVSNCTTWFEYTVSVDSRGCPLD